MTDELIRTGVPREQHERLLVVVVALWAGLESPESRRAYREDWARYRTFLAGHGGHPLTAGAVEVGAYLEHLRTRNLARSTRARALSVLREVYGAIYRAGLRPDNPAREFKLPRAQREPKTPWLTEAQIIAMLRPSGDSWVERRDRLVLLILLGLGLRRSSVARAQVQHLLCRTDGRLGLRVLAKGGKEADLLLPLWLAIEIENWIKFSGVTGALFPRLRRVGYGDVRPELNRPIGPDCVWTIVKDAAERAGIDKTQATPHAIRRSFVTIARTRGVALDDLQAALMHAQNSTTALYDRATRAMASAPGDVLADLYTRSGETTP